MRYIKYFKRQYLLVISLVAILITSTVLALDPPGVVSLLWDFADSNSYSVSAPDKISLTNGSVSLSYASNTLTDDTQAEFEQGTYLNTQLVDGKLSLGNTGLPISNSSNGLIAHWRMNDTWDDEKGTFNGTPMNGLGFTTGKLASGGYFDGVNDYLDFTDSAINSTNYTISVWVKPEATTYLGSQTGGGTECYSYRASNKYVFVPIGRASTVDTDLGLSVGTNGITLCEHQSGLMPYNLVHAVSLSGWNHIAVVNNNNTISLYLNGNFVKYASASGKNRYFTFNYINASSTGFVGSLDEVALYTRPLSDTEVAEIYQKYSGLYGEYTSRIIDTQAADGADWGNLSWAPAAPYWKELPNNQASESAYTSGGIDMTGNVGLWHLNGNWLDSSGNNNNGSAGGNATPLSSPKIGSNGAFFDGSGDYALIPDSASLKPAQYITLSAWSKLNGSQTNNGFIGKRYADTVDPYNSYLLGASGYTYVFCISNGTGGSQSCIYTPTVQNNTWYHVAGVYDGASMKIYLNGELKSSTPKTGNIGYSTSPLTLGSARTSADYYNGWLDEVAIFNRSLSDQEIMNMYARTRANIKFQVRSCDDALCSGEDFTGNIGTSGSYYSEITNNSGNTPVFPMANISNNRYFQYKTYLEADSTINKPLLLSASANYSAYATDLPSVTTQQSTTLAAIPKTFDYFCEGTLDVNNNCTETSVKPTNTEIYYQICNDTKVNCDTNGTWKYWDGNSWENAAANQYNTAAVINSNISALTPASADLTFKAFLASQGQSTPVLSDITLKVSLDGSPPEINASAIIINGLDANDFVITEPVISWTAGQDDAGGLGIFGYCLALDEADPGTTHNLDPATTSGLLQGLNDGVTETHCPFIASSNSLNLSSISGLSLTTGKQYNISIKAVDYSGNIFSGLAAMYQDLAYFIYDGTPPTNPAFISMPSNFLKTKDVTITWPTVGADAAADVGSGLAGLQYKIGADGTWYGDMHNGNQNLTDLLVNDGAYTTHPDFDYSRLLDGNNVIYFRTIDNAGNISSSNITGLLKINTSAPSSVEDLTVTPTNNTLNSYSFSWNPPATFIGDVNLLSYCYTVNTLPTEANCTYTNPGTTTLPADSYATQPGSNNFYVVARDEAGNINYATYSTVEFTYSGEAPGMPTAIAAADISSKENQDWKLAVTWSAPANSGAGVANYKVYRSTVTDAVCSSDPGDFSVISTVSGTSYIDTGLEQRDYYYCIKACDSANNCSAVSGTTSEYPTGKYTVPANLVSEPVVNAVTTRKAVISWTTDRRSDSKIAYGLTSNNYFEAESAVSAQVTAHTVALDNLVAGTTYYYRASWTDEDGNTGISEEKIFVTAPAPHVVSSKVSLAGLDYALIELTVRDTAKVTLLYGSNGALNITKSISTSTSETTYTLRLEQLQDGTLYSYQMELEDTDGYRYRPQETHTFNTVPRPLISNVTIEEIKNVAQPTVKVNWLSNTEITSVVTFAPADTGTPERDAVDLTMGKEHELEIKGLNANTRYILTVKGTDSLGNPAASSVHYFTTATDSRPPKISSLKVESIISESNTDTAQIVVSWETDEPATSQVEYGEGSGGDYSQSTQIDRTLGYKHVVIVSNLKPASVYHFRAISDDSSKNSSATKNTVTITPNKSERALDIVLRGLEGVFGFLN